jgi:hypothetical protein
MATNANRAASSARKAPSRAASAADDALGREPGSPDVPPQEAAGNASEADDAWPIQASRDHLAWEIATCSAVLRGARGLREAQMQAAERAEQSHLEAAERLLGATGLDEMADIQLQLLRADAEQALQYWTRMGELATRGSLEACQEAMAGWARWSATACGGLSQWGRWPTTVRASAEQAEAQVEHVANPLAATPLVWPAQEATRQALDLANATWNDWMSWTGRLADGSARPH